MSASRGTRRHRAPLPAYDDRLELPLEAPRPIVGDRSGPVHGDQGHDLRTHLDSRVDFFIDVYV